MTRPSMTPADGLSSARDLVRRRAAPLRRTWPVPPAKVQMIIVNAGGHFMYRERSAAEDDFLEVVDARLSHSSFFVFRFRL